MSRPGITYSEIASFADLLQSKGQNPTIENIRALSGTGSSTTIANHLKAWRFKQENIKGLCEKEQLPEEIVVCMKALWERVMHQADAKIEQIEQKTQKDAQETSAQLLAQQEKHTQLEHQLKALKEQEKSSKHTNLALSQQLRALEDEKIKTSSLMLGLEKQLEEKLMHNYQLKTHSEQVQANLEHFREASRISAMQERDRFQQAQQQLEQVLKQEKQEQLKSQQSLQALQMHYEQLNATHVAMKSQYESTVAEKESLALRLKEAEMTSTKHYENEKHWQAQFQQAQEKCDKQTISLMALQPEVAVLTHELLTTKEKLANKREQIATLAHEKWVLLEEKAELLRQFKKLEAV